MWPFTRDARELDALRARVEALEAEVDLGQLEHLRKSTLTALRALRRAQQAEVEREEPLKLQSFDPRQMSLDPRLIRLQQDIQRAQPPAQRTG